MKRIILTIVMAVTLMTSCKKTKSQECMVMDEEEFYQATVDGYCLYARDSEGNIIYDAYGNAQRAE